MAIKFLGSLAGTGKLRADSDAIRSVDYQINVHKDGHLNRGEGFIHGDLFGLNSMTGKAVLELSDGNTVEIYLDQISPLQGKAIVSTSGPVPGF